jgi:hypothetical protein
MSSSAAAQSAMSIGGIAGWPPQDRRRAIPMVIKFAYCNLFHDRLSLRAMFDAKHLLGMALRAIVIQLSRDTTLLIVKTPKLATMLLLLTVGMCALAAICAIFKVTRIDPAVVFSR